MVGAIHQCSRKSSLVNQLKVKEKSIIKFDFINSCSTKNINPNDEEPGQIGISAILILI